MTDKCSFTPEDKTISKHEIQISKRSRYQCSYLIQYCLISIIYMKEHSASRDKTNVLRTKCNTKTKE